jgi:hypothetical protein
VRWRSSWHLRQIAMTWRNARTTAANRFARPATTVIDFGMRITHSPPHCGRLQPHVIRLLEPLLSLHHPAPRQWFDWRPNMKYLAEKNDQCWRPRTDVIALPF